MYLRQYSKLPFFEGFNLFRKLKLLNPIQHDPIIYIQRPPSAQLGYPLRSEVRDTENQKVLNKLMNRYPDLKYAPFIKEGEGEVQNQPAILRFLKQYNSFKDKGYTDQKAFEKAEQIFQSAMQRKIDQINISNNLAITNHARSFMTMSKQEIEYESRLKRDRLIRDMKISEFEKQSPLDSLTEGLMEKYRKTLIRVVHNQDDPIQTDAKQDEELFTQRAANVFDCYYERVTVKDKLSGLTDTEILQNIRDSPSKIKNRLKKFSNILQEYNVHISDDRKLVIPADIPEDVKKKLQKGIFYIAALYKEIGFEFQHHKHLDVYEQILKKLKEIKGPIKRDEDAEQAIDKALNSAEIQRQSSYKLFETPQERLKRLEIKWVQRKIMELSVQQVQAKEKKSDEDNKIIEERLKHFQTQAKDLVNSLRKLKLKLEHESLVKTGNQLFEEHAEIINDRELFLNATKLEIEDVKQYFKLPFEKRRLTQAAQVNDDMIHNLIKVQALKSNISKLNQDELENRVSESSLIQDNQEFLKRKLVEQYKLIQSARIKKVRVSEEEQIKQNEEEEGDVLYAEQLQEGANDDLQTLQQKQREARLQLEKEKAAEAKKKEDELKSQQAVKGQKGSKKKKPTK